MIYDPKKINVTHPFLPPLEEFSKYLEDIWESRWLTNNGKFHCEFEEALANYLGVKYVSLFSNGTIALITALQCLNISGEVITSPYSFVASSHALFWNRINPIFVDIESDNCNINPSKIVEAITPSTTAIMPIHVYGMPCKHLEIQQIANDYGLKLIYDACHAFGVKENGNSILNYGDMSVLSFHATKVFNTFEGGAIISNDPETKKRIDYLKNFGFENEVTVVTNGINGKMNEFQSALGILQLKYIDSVIEKRKRVSEIYRIAFADCSLIRILPEQNGFSYNFSYFPIFFETENPLEDRDAMYIQLKKHNIYARRYFYPLISDFPTYSEIPSAQRENLGVSHRVSDSVLCIPIFPDLEIDKAQEIADLILDYLNKKLW